MLDPKLQKRVTWITNCAAVASFSLITNDDWKSSFLKVFLEVNSTIIWYEYQGIWSWKIQDLQEKICYYLGRFPFYWNFETGQPLSPIGRHWVYIPIDFERPPSGSLVLPEGLKTPVQEWNGRPTAIDGDWYPTQLYDADVFEHEHGINGRINYDRQEIFNVRRKTLRDQCLEKNYPKK